VRRFARALREIDGIESHLHEHDYGIHGNLFAPFYAFLRRRLAE
jgi:hypothetical protein